MAAAYKLKVFERGSGPPVILLHGNMSSHRYWWDVARQLGAKYRVITPDLLGFGASPKPRKAAYDLDQMVACLEATFSDHHFQQKPILAGHSMGAIIALRWACLRPDLFAGVLMSAPVFFQKDSFHSELASIFLEGRRLTDQRLARVVTAGMGMARFVPTPLAIRAARSWPQHIIQDATSYHGYVFRSIMNHAVYMDEVFDDLARVTIPTYILLGEDDWTSRHVWDRLEKFCSEHESVRLKVVPGGHQLPLEHPQIVQRAIAHMTNHTT